MNTIGHSADMGRVLKALPRAWYCDCGCRTVYDNGTPISGGVDEADAWKGALEHHKVRRYFRRLIDRAEKE